MASVEPNNNPSSAPDTSALTRPGLAFTIIQFLSSLLAALVSGVIGLVLFVFSVGEGLSSGLQILVLAGTAVWVGVLVLPSLVFSFLRLTNKPVREDFLSRRGLRLAGLLIVLFPFAMLLGNWALQQNGIGSLPFPIFHILATSVPVIWLIYLAVRGLPVGSPQRAWGVFGSGLLLGPMLILTLETLALLGVFVLFVVVVVSQPQLMDELSSITRLLETTPQNPPTPEALLELFGPYLTQPLVIWGTLAFAALLVPLIEEALKPIGVWLLASRQISPSAGFAAGALSGAGYALFENLLLTANSETWATVQIARIGTSIIHILTTALVGYALAIAWQRRRYWQLLGVYLVAVLLHGAWNAMSLLMTFGEIQQSLNNANWWSSLSNLAPYAMGALAIFSLAILVWFNFSLRRGRAGKLTTPTDQLP